MWTFFKFQNYSKLLGPRPLSPKPGRTDRRYDHSYGLCRKEQRQIGVERRQSPAIFEAHHRRNSAHSTSNQKERLGSIRTGCEVAKMDVIGV